jgi:hypothetical protein
MVCSSLAYLVVQLLQVLLYALATGDMPERPSLASVMSLG